MATALLPTQTQLYYAMEITLPFGLTTQWTLDINEPSITRLGPSVDAKPMNDPASAVRKSLRVPLDYPSLANATVPGDQVVVTIPAGMPAVGPLAWGILQALQDAGIESEHVILLVTDKTTELELLAYSPLQAQNHDGDLAVRIERHDPHKAESCSFIGVTQSGQPLRMNRLIGEANLVLPLGTTSATAESDTDTPPPLSGLFPDFSDQEALDRFYAPSSRENRVHRAQRSKEIEEASKLVTSGAVIQVIPASSNQIATLFAGHPTSVATAAREACRNTWMPKTSARGDLVIGLLTGSTTTHSWTALGQALQVGETLLEPGGTLVFCSDLKKSPGRSLGHLCQQDERTNCQHEIMRDREADSWTALQLSRALQRGPVYMHSRLDDSVIENLGMTPIASSKELSRLVSNHTHSIILDDVQWLVPVVR